MQRIVTGLRERGRRRARWALALWAAGWASPATGQDAAPADAAQLALLNVPLPTLGGAQFWTDYQWRRGWRIQQNAVSGHWRLIDDRNVRMVWGNYAACEHRLNTAVPDRSIQASRVVILMHGLMRSWRSMQPLERPLEVELDAEAIGFEYASGRRAIADHAAALRQFVAGLPPEVPIDFVGHSMGNIVLRHAIADWQAAGDRATLDRIEHIVMLGPPNQGAAIARQLGRTGLFAAITGDSGMSLGPNWEEFETHLAIPHCPFGIIAGRIPETSWQNPLVDGASDLVVSVEETRLEGAADFLEVPRMHSFLMQDPQVQTAVAHFLRKGRFR